VNTPRVGQRTQCATPPTGIEDQIREALNKSWRMRGSRIGMGCKADFAANSWLLARNSTPQTTRARLIARRRGLVQRFLSLQPNTDGRHQLWAW